MSILSPEEFKEREKENERLNKESKIRDLENALQKAFYDYIPSSEGGRIPLFYNTTKALSDNKGWAIKKLKGAGWNVKIETDSKTKKSFYKSWIPFLPVKYKFSYEEFEYLVLTPK